MQALPKKIADHFDILLHHRTIPKNVHAYYKKWLRFYWDFCHKERGLNNIRKFDAGFLFVFKAEKQAHSWLRNCFYNAEDGQKDKSRSGYY